MTGMEAEAASRAARVATWKHRLVWFGIASAVLAVAILVRLAEGDRPANAAAPAQAAKAAQDEQALPRVERPQHDVMALVNGKDVSRKQLMDACIERYGEEVLESLVNKRLIMNHCANRNITVTEQEIAAEIDRMAERFQLGREQWLELLQKERDVSPQEYARDIVWPTLALRKLADAQLQVTEDEIAKAYEREYGAMVRARLIAVSDADKARQLHAQLTAKPDDFARLAIEHSEDVNSASIGGMIQPIRRHVGDEAIENAAFALKPGQVSSIIEVANQFVILKCDEILNPTPVPMNPAIKQRLVEKIKDAKLREAATGIFAAVQKSATILNVYNNPELSRTMPGVVATVNGDRITIAQLGEECLLRHGEEVLETEISRLLLEQALAAANVQVTREDLEAEMRHAAELAGVVDQAGNADLAKWVETVTAEQGVTPQQYERDAVWPSAALKKLTAQDVVVDETDLQKGFEANFGQRVRCRAIVLSNMRRAQEVWDKARRNPSPDYFGDLAAEYSEEPTSKALRGEVPPLGRHGGQPQIEEVAFQLEAGQMSGIIQIADKFVILRCEGRTERIDVDLETVRDELYRDIHEKKLRIAMGQKFEEINAKARVDNYLAGTSQQPDTSKGSAQQPVREDAAVRPTAAVR